MPVVVFLHSTFRNIQNHLAAQWVQIRNDVRLQAVRFIQAAECGIAIDNLSLVSALDELAVLRGSIVAMSFDGRILDHDLELVREALEMSAQIADCRPRLSDGIHAMLALMNREQTEKFDVSLWYMEHILPYFPATPPAPELSKYIFGDADSPEYVPSDSEELALASSQVGIRSGRRE
ncbi:hypothetical protein BYT27DRAFT_7342267 [Phlegmacium glaucopus]|nr:hypothetical protein BYT27DRAFT_7342267 [Phlegmacium glaucopus]